MDIIDKLYEQLQSLHALITSNGINDYIAASIEEGIDVLIENALIEGKEITTDKFPAIRGLVKELISFYDQNPELVFDTPRLNKTAGCGEIPASLVRTDIAVSIVESALSNRETPMINVYYSDILRWKYETLLMPEHKN